MSKLLIPNTLIVAGSVSLVSGAWCLHASLGLLLLGILLTAVGIGISRGLRND